MRRTPAAATILFALALATAAGAQDQSVDEILNRLADASSELNSLVTGYSQIEVDEFGDKTVLSGTFYYLKPGRYRWALEVGGKVVEEMVSNGTHGWRIRHSVKTVDKVKLETIKRRTGGITLTGGAEELRASYDISFAGIDELDTGTAYHLICNPKPGVNRADSLIRRMELWINIEHPAPVVKVVVRQRDGIVVSLEFNNLRRNAPVAARYFEYHVPNGYEEITY